MKKYLIAFFVLFISPTFLFAATTFKSFVQSAITNVAYTAISLIISVAVLYFFIGVIKFIYASRNGIEEGVTEGKKTMLWATISIFVMISVFGIVKLAQSLTGMSGIVDVNMPALQDTMFGK